MAAITVDVKGRPYIVFIRRHKLWQQLPGITVAINARAAAKSHTGKYLNCFITAKEYYE